MSGTFRALSQGPRSKHHFRALEAKCYSPKGRRGLPVLRLIDARRRALRVAHPCASASLVTPMPRPVNQCPSSRQHWALLRLWRSAACTMSHAWSLGRLGCVAPPPGQMQWNGEIRAHTRVQPSEPLKRHSSTGRAAQLVAWRQREHDCASPATSCCCHLPSTCACARLRLPRLRRRLARRRPRLNHGRTTDWPRCDALPLPFRWQTRKGAKTLPAAGAVSRGIYDLH